MTEDAPEEKGAKVLRCLMLVCNGPLNALVLGLLGLEIEKYQNAGENVFLTLFKKPEQTKDEKFRVRSLPEEIQKMSAKHLRESVINWDKFDAEHLGLKKDKTCFEVDVNNKFVLDDVMKFTVSLFEKINGASANEDDKGVKALYDAMKEQCDGDDDVLKKAQIGYRIISTGPIDAQAKSDLYKDAFLSDLTVYDICGTRECLMIRKELMKKLKGAETEFITTGNLSKFTQLESEILVASVPQDLQTAAFGSILAESPPDQNGAFANAVVRNFFQ